LLVISTKVPRSVIFKYDFACRWVKPESLLCRGREDGEGQLGVAEGLVPSSNDILGVGRTMKNVILPSSMHIHSFQKNTSIDFVSKAGMGPKCMAIKIFYTGENERLTHSMELGVPFWR
jgi:hypothetical protein